MIGYANIYAYLYRATSKGVADKILLGKSKNTVAWTFWGKVPDSSVDHGIVFAAKTA